MTIDEKSPAEQPDLRHLGRNTLIYAGSIIIDRLLGLALIPILTRILSKSEYGAWAQTSVTAGVLVTVVLYAFPTLIVRHQSIDTGPEARQKAFNNIGLLCIVFCTFWCGAMLSTPTTIARLVYGNATYTLLIPALLLWVFAEAAVEYAIAWLRAMGRIGSISGVVIARSTIRMSLVLVLTRLNEFPLDRWLILHSSGLVIFAVIVLLLTGRLIRSGESKSTPPKTSPLNLQILEATPLVALSLLGILSGYLDRYLLTAWFGLPTVAIYAAAASLAAVPAMIHSVLGFTVFPVMARQWSTGRQANATHLMNQALLLYLFFAIPIALSTAGFGAWALQIFTTREYEVSSTIFIAMSSSVLCLGVQQILVYGLLLDGRGAKMLFLATLAVGLNFLLALFLVPKLGMLGAAVAAAMANFAAMVATARQIAALLKWRFPWHTAARTIGRAIFFTLPALIFSAIGILSNSIAFSILIIFGLIYLATDWRSDCSLLRSLVSTRMQ